MILLPNLTNMYYMLNQYGCMHLQHIISCLLVIICITDAMSRSKGYATCGRIGDTN